MPEIKNFVCHARWRRRHQECGNAVRCGGLCAEGKCRRRAFRCHRHCYGSLDSSSVNEITVIPIRKFLPLNFGKRKLPRTTIHTDQNLWENPNSGNIKTFHSGEMDVYLSRKLTLIG